MEQLECDIPSIYTEIITNTSDSKHIKILVNVVIIDGVMNT